MSIKSLKTNVYNFLKAGIVFPENTIFESKWTNPNMIPPNTSFMRLTFLDGNETPENRDYYSGDVKMLLEVQCPDDLEGHLDIVLDFLKANITLGGLVRSISDLHWDSMEAILSNAQFEVTFIINTK